MTARGQFWFLPPEPTGFNATTLGAVKDAYGDNSVVIGHNASAPFTPGPTQSGVRPGVNNTVVIGTNALARQTTPGAIVIGYNASTSQYDPGMAVGSPSVIIGNGANAFQSGVVIGGDAVGNTFSTTIGAGANGQNYCVAIGNGAKTGSSNGATVIGNLAGTGVASGSSIIIGAGAYISAGAAAIAIGSSSSNATANGTGTFCSGNFGVAIGCSAGALKTTAAAGGVALGGSENVAVTAGQTAVAIGYNAQGTNQGAVAIGPWAGTDFQGEIAFGTGRWTANGDFKLSMVPLRVQTTDATVTEMTTGKGDQGAVAASAIVLTNNSTYIFDVDIVARKSTTGTDYSAWNLKGCINREANAASTALVGSVTKTLIGQTAGASTWDVSMTADTTNGRPNISVTGQAGTTIRWVGNVRMTKVQG